jgi:small conductance mechanosensitive channel
MAGDLAVNLVVAALIFGLTLFIASWAGKAMERMLSRTRGTRHDPLLRGFLIQIARVLIISVGLIAVLQRLGVQTTSIIAVLGAASLAIALALQGTLSNVAAGVMLLMLRPYRVGDVVQIGDRMGTVQKMDLFTTRIIDPANMRLTVPNSKVLDDVIINISGQRTRRIDLKIGVDYDSHLGEVLEVFSTAAASHPNVLADPPTWAGPSGFLDSSIEITVYAWVKSPNYLQTKADLHVILKQACDDTGIVIPYPHQVAVERADAAPKVTRRKKPEAVIAAPTNTSSAAGKASSMAGE